MKKTIAIIISILIFSVSCNQKSGAVKKKSGADTVYLIDVTDTVPATVLYKKDTASDQVFTASGFALVRGLKTIQDGKPVWAQEPQLVGAVNEKKEPVKNLIRVL